MFRVIGGAVVYGLALYGVVKILERPKVGVIIQPNTNDGVRGGGAATEMGESDVEGQSAVGETPTSASTAETA
jgi:hypothetical protein